MEPCGSMAETAYPLPYHHTATPPALRWTLLIDPPAPGWRNMAIDCALLDLADRDGAPGGQAFLRLYRWNPFCLSFGRHEPATRRYDRERIRALGLDCVRRPTGGRAVWHARELTYSVAAPLSLFGGLRAAYYRIHQTLAAALRALGASPELAPATPLPGLSAGPCFAARAGGEVLVEGWKVIGSAQLRQGTAFLQHGSLLLEDDQALVRELAGLREPGEAPPPGARDAGPPAEAPLARLLGRSLTFDQAAAAIVGSASSLPGGESLRGMLPASAAELAARHEDQFRSPDWTWER